MTAIIADPSPHKRMDNISGTLFSLCVPVYLRLFYLRLSYLRLSVGTMTGRRMGTMAAPGWPAACCMRESISVRT
jgi:hypothetical protein